MKTTSCIISLVLGFFFLSFASPAKAGVEDEVAKKVRSAKQALESSGTALVCTSDVSRISDDEFVNRVVSSLAGLLPDTQVVKISEVNMAGAGGASGIRRVIGFRLCAILALEEKR